MPTRDSTFVSNGQLTVVQIEVPERDQTWVENGQLTVVSAGGGGAAPSIGDQTIAYGALTLASAGGAKALDSKGDEVDFVSVDAQAGFTRTWSVSSGRLIANGTPGVDDGKTLTATTSLGQIQVTIHAIANAWSVATIAQLETAGEHASLAYGDSILLRTGTYDNLPTLTAIRRSALNPIVGTFTPPSDHADADQGPDLDTANYVKITPHDGATPVITYLAMDGSQNADGGFRLTGLTFNRPNTPDVEITSPQSNPMLNLLAINNVAVDNCLFMQTPSGEVVADVHAGLRTTGGSNLKIIDNELYDTWDGILATARTDGIDIIGNVGRRQNNDCVKIFGGDDIRINWNEFSDKKQPGPESGAHVDYIQFSMTGVTFSPDNIRLIGNRLWRGNGSPPRESDPPGSPSMGLDGQGIFISDLTSSYTITNLAIEGNIIGNCVQRGISVTRATDPIIRNNVAVHDLNAETTNNANVGIYLETCTNGLVENNIFNTYSDTANAGTATFQNNVTVTRNTTAYNVVFDGPTYGEGVTDPASTYSIKAGGTADILTPKAGAAGTGYVDYDARTYEAPSGGDSTAPVLSSPDATATGETTADLEVTTDEDNGTLYAVVTTSATPPSKAQVKAGQDHAGSAAAFADDQAIVSTGVKSFGATGLMSSTAYFDYYMHEDAAANQSDVEAGPGFTTDAASYAPNFVDSNGTAFFSTAGGPSNDAQGTWFFRVKPQSVAAGNASFYVAAGRTSMSRTTAKLSLTIKDSANTTVYQGSSTNDVFAVGVEARVYVAIDLSVPSLSIKVNGSDVAMTDTTSLIAGNGLIHHSRATTYFASTTGPTGLLDVQISDFFFDATQVIAESAFHDGSGGAIDLAGVGAPFVRLGSNQTADEKGGNSSQGWNDGYNLGSGGALTVGSATFTDA